MHDSAVLGKFFLAFALTVFAVWALAPPAYACLCAWHPAMGFVGPESGRLPENAAGVTWYVDSGAVTRGVKAVDDDRFTVEILERGRLRYLPAKVRFDREFPMGNITFLIYVIAPRTGGLTPYATYRVTDNVAVRDGYSKAQVIVTIDPDRLSESSEYTVGVLPPDYHPVTLPVGGTCSVSAKAVHARIYGNLPPEARAWQDQLLYRTILDDGRHWLWKPNLCHQVIPGRSPVQVGEDRVFTVCEKSYGHGLKPGKHRVVMEAYLPGTDVVLKTPAKFVKLQCPDFDRFFGRN